MLCRSFPSLGVFKPVMTAAQAVADIPSGATLLVGG
jgi:hypothetical protein